MTIAQFHKLARWKNFRCCGCPVGSRFCWSQHQLSPRLSKPQQIQNRPTATLRHAAPCALRSLRHSEGGGGVLS